LPPSADRDSLELELLVNLEAALMTTRGWGAPERIKTLQRAYGVAQRFGETPRLLPVLQALSSVHIARGVYRAGLEEARQLLTLGKKASHELYEVMGLRLVGTAYFFLGHCEQARQSLEAGLRGYAALPAQARRSFHVSAAEENVRLRVWLAHALLLTGDVARARTISREALASAEALDYVGVKGLALSSAGVSLHATARRPQATLRYAKQLLAMGEEHDFPSYRGWGAFYRGWALAFQGQPETGIPGMEAGLEKLRGTGTEASLVSLLTLLAEIYTSEGQCEAGEDALHEALALSEETGARSHGAEIHRVQALLHLEDQDVEAAEASLLHAIDVAREQSAKFFELRASVALARLWEDQGRALEAHARLSRIYDTFTESADVPDLVAAHALLERLATAPS
jgi:tetratricopeptide (TPR) repeat protein